MNLMRWIVTYLCKLGMAILCRIDAKEMAKVPANGPLLTFANHTGTVEAPIIYTQLTPRKKVTALAKIETWDNWFLNWVFTLWGIIPIHRGEADMVAMRKALDALENGYILGISPEGTRSRQGMLRRAHGGVAMLALHSGAPLQAIAHWGGENFGTNVKHFKRTDFHIRVGPVFQLDSQGQRVTKEIRQQMADEMMYQLAKLLPEEFRGEYSDLENATEKYLRFVA
ncbi:MAG: lysophospholipid acyltransferase family protein [Chloroflexi bacterium]|nr:lysophospholipid acyltransferase family protein [Chloroflexota bacterium]